MVPGGSCSRGGAGTGVAIASKVLTVDLAGVTSPSKVKVAFPGIEDLSGNLGTESRCLGVLSGDANGDGSVNIFDLRDVRLVMDQPVAAANFRYDVNADGNINIFDLRDIRLVLDNVLSGSCP